MCYLLLPGTVSSTLTNTRRRKVFYAACYAGVVMGGIFLPISGCRPFCYVCECGLRLGSTC